MKDFYYILGVTPQSTLLEIIEAYEKLSPKFDPVLNGHDSFYTKQFNEVREAFHVLTDPGKRKHYDEELQRLNSATKVASAKKNAIGSITPKIDVTFSLILILLTGVFGSYVYRSIYQNYKKTPIVSQPVVNAPPAAPIAIRHKLKKRVKHPFHLDTKMYAAVKPIAAVATTVKSVAAIAIPVKTATPVTYSAVKTGAPVANTVTKTNLAAPSYIVSKPTITPRVENVIDEEPVNEAEVRANETGVVYLREYAQFRAPVIKTLLNRARIIILEKGSKYYKVQSDDAIGYIPKWAIKQTDTENGF